MTGTTTNLFEQHVRADEQRAHAAEAAARAAQHPVTGPGSAYRGVVDALDAGNYVSRRGENETRARCPAHDGDGPNLAVRRGHDGVLITCHSHGCTAEQISTALGLSMSDLFDAPSGVRVYSYAGGGVKRRQRQPDGKKRVLWDRGTRPALLPLWIPEAARLDGDEHGTLALAAALRVHLAEGEKTADALAFMGVDGCPASFGSTSDANTVDLAPLAGKHVTVWADQDEPGQGAAQTVVNRAKAAGAASVEVQQVPAPFGDAADLWEAHGTDWVAGLPTAEPAVLKVSAASARRGAARIVGRKASEIQPTRVRWLWADRIPLGTLAVFAGRGGEGKSTFALHLAAQLTRGTLPGEFEGQPVNVGIASLEDPEDAVTVPRLIGAGADLERVTLFNADSAGSLVMLPHSADALSEFIREHELCAIILDPATSMLDGDHNKRHEVREALDPLLNIAGATGCTVIMVQHLNKGGGAISDKVSGSAAFRDASRCLLLFAADIETGERIATFDKGDYSASLAASLSFKIASAAVELGDGERADVGTVHGLTETDRDAQSVFNARYQIESDDAAKDRNEAEQFIVGYLRERGGAAPAREAIREGVDAGFTEGQMKKARLRCKAPKIATAKLGFGGAVVWKIEPDESASTIDSTSVPRGSTFSEVESMEPMEVEVESTREPERSAGDALAADLYPAASALSTTTEPYKLGENLTPEEIEAARRGDLAGVSKLERERRAEADETR